MKTLPIAFIFLVCGLFQTRICFATGIVLPPDARVEWVSTELDHNGQSMSVRTFESAESVDDVLLFYRDQWHIDGEVPGFVENRIADWSMISQLQATRNIVLQVKTNRNGGSSGFLSTLAMNKFATNFDDEFPVSSEIEHVSTTRTATEDTETHTSIYTSISDIDSATAFYQDYFLRRGWSVAKDDKQGRNRVVLFDKQGDRCELVTSVAEDSSTVIFINRVVRHD